MPPILSSTRLTLLSSSSSAASTILASSFKNSGPCVTFGEVKTAAAEWMKLPSIEPDGVLTCRDPLPLPPVVPMRGESGIRGDGGGPVMMLPEIFIVLYLCFGVGRRWLVFVATRSRSARYRYI